MAMDPQSLHCFVNLRYIPGDRTMFQGIYRLLPGHFMVVKEGTVSMKQYWSPNLSSECHPEEYYITTLRKILEASVARHLISDVPVGIMLSGGIDSSSIVALASQMMDEPPKMFCMGFCHGTDEVAYPGFVAK